MYLYTYRSEGENSEQALIKKEEKEQKKEKKNK